MTKAQIFEKYKHFLLLALYGLTGIIFGICEKHITSTTAVYSKLDDYIPFVKEAVIPYLFWYVYIVSAIIYLGFTSKIDYCRLIAFIISGMSISIIIFILFPSRQDLRPIVTNNDIFSMIIKNIYKVDTPTNVTPSIHVIISIAVHIALVNCETLKDNKKFKIVSFLCMMLICVSTVLIKQHSIIDIFCGIVVAIVIYLVIYKVFNPLPLKSYAKSSEVYRR